MNRSITLALGLFVATVGCTSPMSTLRTENRRLTNSVSEMRQERRSQDRRVRDLQHQLDQLRAQVATGAGADRGVPNLPVEVAGPSAPATSSHGTGVPGQRVVAISDDGTEIVYEGDAAAGKVATIDEDPPAPPPVRRIASVTPASTSRGGSSEHAIVQPPLDPHLPVPKTSDRIDSQPGKIAPLPTSRAARTSPVPTRGASEPTERSPDAANAYRDAVELVKGGKYDEGVTALRAFIKQYPRHDYADNAQYWIGEAFYARKEYQASLTEFRNVIETFPRGNKVPDALLKVGYCYQSLGQKEKARAVLEQVVNLYPKSEPAALAAKRLETP